MNDNVPYLILLKFYLVNSLVEWLVLRKESAEQSEGVCGGSALHVKLGSCLVLVDYRRQVDHAYFMPSIWITVALKFISEHHEKDFTALGSF
jgi:hypothetical protein